VDDNTIVGEAKKQTFDLQAKWYVNGFPKSGTHLIGAMVEQIANPMPATVFRDRPWASTWQDTMTHEERPWSVLCWHLAELLPGYLYKAHAGWKHDLEAFMWCLGYCHVFIYRDLRDVAVSLAHHALSDNEALVYSGRDQIREQMGGDFDAVLSAVIGGMDGYPGVVERWEDYAPWLDVPWVHKVRFEEAVAGPRRTARDLLDYALVRLGEVFHFQADLSDEAEDTSGLIEKMAQAVERRDSLTFRRGIPGEWREVFTDEHKELFKQTDKSGWLVRLGYEESPDW
jgi:hypothetical protein